MVMQLNAMSESANARKPAPEVRASYIGTGMQLLCMVRVARATALTTPGRTPKKPENSGMMSSTPANLGHPMRVIVSATNNEKPNCKPRTGK